MSAETSSEAPPAPNPDQPKNDSKPPSSKPAPEEKKPASPVRKWLLRGAAALVIVGGAIFGTYSLIHSYHYESTDDAFLEAHVVTIASKLSNLVARVLVNDNDEVAAGQLLVEIDPRDYQVQIDSARANFIKAKSDFERNQALSQSRAISQGDLDAARASFDVTKAQLDQAQLNLLYTRIVAPIAGRITLKSVETGDYVQTGQTLFSIVPHEIYIVANYKETQLTHMQVGQPVDISIDSFPGQVFRGHIDSFQAGTGARFSLLPAENATGNYVKVVQRVPVKIEFDEPLAVKKLFAPGLSVTPEVRVR